MGVMRTLVVLPVLLAAAAFGPGAAPPGVATTDVHGDPLPRGARARLGTTRLRHGHILSGLAFSGDGKTLASVASDHSARLWDLATGKEIHSFGAETAHANVYRPSRWLTCVAVSHDGKTVASGSMEGFVTIWEAATGKELHRLQPAEGVVCLDFAPDGKSLATAGRAATVRVWDPATGKELYQVGGHAEATTRVLFSPDSKTLAAGASDGSVRLWDVGTKRERHRLTGHAQAITALAFSEDGKRLASGSGELLLVWDAAAGKEVRRLEYGGAAGIGLTPDGKTVVSAGKDGQIRLWDIATGKARELDGPPDVLTTAALSPDGKTLALGSYQSTVYLWDLVKGKEQDRPAGHRGHVHLLAFSRDGRQVSSAGGEGSFWEWDADSGREVRRLLLAKDMSRTSPGAAAGGGVALAFSSEGRLAAIRKKEGDIGILEPGTGKERRLKGGFVSSGALTLDGRTFAAGRSDGSIQIWEADTGKELRRLTGHTGQVGRVAFSPDGAALASIGSEGTLRLWEVKTGRELWQVALPADRALRLAFSPDGRSLAAGGADGTARVWETATGQQVRQLSGHRGYILALCFSSDGRSLAVGSWMSVRLWDLATGKGRGELLCHKGDVMSLAFSPDSKMLATGGSDTTVLLWDVATAYSAAPAPAELTAKDVESRWADLTADADKGYQAVWDLAGAPKQAGSLFEKHLSPAPAADAKRVKKLIDDLGSEEFDVRKRAEGELQKVGEAAAPALREALKGADDVDLRLRLKVLLDDATAAVPAGERLRTLRAVQALELAGTREAEALLKKLAAGAAEARLTREAKAALGRLAAARR